MPRRWPAPSAAWPRSCATVEALRAEGEDILLLVGSDHGQETIGAAVSLEDWLAERGLWRQLEAGDIAVAGQGTAALLYATDRGRTALLGVLDAMSREPWADGVLVGEALAARGFAAEGGVVAAVNMARRPTPTARRPGQALGRGRRQAGAGRQRPARRLGAGRDPAVPDGQRRPHRRRAREPSSLVDIAPTLIGYLGLPTEGFDGTPSA